MGDSAEHVSEAMNCQHLHAIKTNKQLLFWHNTTLLKIASKAVSCVQFSFWKCCWKLVVPPEALTLFEEKHQHCLKKTWHVASASQCPSQLVSSCTFSFSCKLPSCWNMPAGYGTPWSNQNFALLQFCGKVTMADHGSCCTAHTQK